MSPFDITLINTDKQRLKVKEPVRPIDLSRWLDIPVVETVGKILDASKKLIETFFEKA